VGTVINNVTGQRTRSNMKSELVMLLKPTIIRGNSGWQNDLAEVQERLGGFEQTSDKQPR
jgi:type II secretory pathway component GspD/PulD (secretin)